LKTNYVLVDFENVQPKDISLLNGRSFKIKVFVGANQSKFPSEMAMALQEYGPDAKYEKISGSGRNALDFHIAYYIGRLATENPGASCYVISKDKGFDPLINHVKEQGFSCHRLTSIADIPGVKVSGSKSIPQSADMTKPSDSRTIAEKVDSVIGHLTKFKAAKPKTLKALQGTVKALFKNKLTEAELGELVGQLTERGALKVSDGKVTYELPFQSKLSSSEPIADNVDAIIGNLAGRKTGRPKTLKALRGTINALFRNKLPDAELDALIEKLTKREVIRVADGKITYGLPS
jgi:hypothetical protein